ncbi:MAG: YopT-type cysteine protease domain-containing protein [Acetobacteraceae bacterium]
MAYFGNGKSKIELAAKLTNVPVIGLYDQGEDAALMKLGNSTGGACIALCLRWLGCTMLNRNFWETTFKGKNQLKDPNILDSVMGWLENCDSVTRNQRIQTLAGNLGLAKYQGKTKSEMNWEAGMLKKGGAGLLEEVFDADCHSMMGLAQGATIGGSAGEGHALAFIRTAEDARRFYDPNFGEFIVTEWNFELFLTQLWRLGKYDVFRSFLIRRYHPRA